jgi:hypothetical protein
MSSRLAFAVLLAGLMLAIPAVAPRMAPLLAQSALAPLGLTDAQARRFLFEELKSQTPGHRRTSIAVTGHRAFYKLPASARGPAATALFAWARAHVNSTAFTTAYATFRREANPVDTRAQPSVDERLANELTRMREGIEQAKQIAASLPPADRGGLLEQVSEQEARMRDPAWVGRLRSMLELEARGREESNTSSGRKFDEEFPADPNLIVARRLRRFLDDTADADFSAPIIRLTDGPDGMEFIEPAHRAKSPTWQLAVLAGREATTAARAAAEAWLKELAP